MTEQEYFGVENILGQNIWHSKYQYNNESFEEWLERVSGGDQSVKKLIKEKKFLYGGRILSNRRTADGGSYHNCYSSGYAPDDYDGLMELNKNIGLTYKAQGGQGISLSMLRPKGTSIKTRYESDGIVPFMEIFNCTTAQTSQGGSRKGALMLSLDARHKEIETFVKIKTEPGKIEKANLSVELDDEFMEAVDKYYKTGEEIVLHEKRNYSGHEIEYDIIPIKIYKKIIENAYDWGEPGCIFTNRFRNFNIMEMDNDYVIITGNPCGEQPLSKNASCCLGSINLSAYVENAFTDDSCFCTGEFLMDVATAIKAMDDIIDESLPFHPLKEQAETSHDYRNIGVGVMGFGTMLMKMGITYGSEKSITFTNYIFKEMFRTAIKTSSKLAEEYGSFPKYKPVVFDSTIIKDHFSNDEISILRKQGLRNCSLLSIAPTGSLATMLGISTGIEPEFSIKYTRKTESLNAGAPSYFDVYCSAAQEYINSTGKKNLPSYFVCANDINWKDRISIQATTQNHIDTAISSTVNLPKDISVENIENLYLVAWREGLKGITIFRDGCKRAGILTRETTAEQPTQTNSVQYDSIIPVSRKVIGTTIGKTYCKKCACGTLYITVNRDNEGNIVESFIHTSKGGICQANINAVNRMMSLAMRSGVKIDEIVDQLRGIDCKACTSLSAKGRKIDGLSCPDILARTIEEFRNNTSEEIEKSITEKPNAISKHNAIFCPECGEPIANEGGCITCKNCAWSKCS